MTEREQGKNKDLPYILARVGGKTTTWLNESFEGIFFYTNLFLHDKNCIFYSNFFYTKNFAFLHQILKLRKQFLKKNGVKNWCKKIGVKNWCKKLV